tara:strand:- start:2586 stop:3095 length:510 start_codon:yes stop_codon:yes gene_type:complete
MSEEARFIDNGDGTIYDKLFNLTWMKNDSYLDLKKFLSFSQAKKYVDKINKETFAGHSNWRLPNKKEAQSLYDYSHNHSVLDKYGMKLHIDPVFPPGGGYNTWTSETRGKITAYVFQYSDGGGQHNEVDGTVSTSVRLVRGDANADELSKLGKIPPPKTTTPIGGGGWR